MVPAMFSSRSLPALLAAAFVAATVQGCTPAPKPVAMPAPVQVPVQPPDATAPPPPAAVAKAEQVRELEGITEYRLANGMQVLLFPDQTKSTFTVNMTYFVGSKHEGYGETGMAHLLEHMTFKGTEKYGELLAELETRGAFSNGTTWYDRTNYFETLPASSENLAFALDVEAERMRKAKMRAEDLATEFSVVRSEFEIGENDPFGVLLERVASAAYLWHNYGKSTIGSRADIEKVPIANLKAFYDKYYQPDNAMLVVAGKFDPAEALALIEQIYGPIPKPSRALDPSWTVEPVQDGERSVTLRRNGENHIVLAAYHMVAGPHPDFAAIDAAADILTNQPSGRLYGSLVKSKLASSVFGFTWPLREPGLVYFGAQVRDAKHVAKVRQAMLDAIEGLGATAITDAEVERYKNDALKNLELQLADSQSVAIELSEWAAMGDWRLLFAHRDRVKRLTAEEVKGAAARWLKPANRTLGEFIPTKEADRAPQAEAPDVVALAESVKPGVIEEGEAFVASLDNLEARTKFAKLAGGIEAAMLPKKTRGGTVQLRLTLRHGDLKSLVGKHGIGAATAQMVQRGTTKRTYQQLEDEKNRLKARVSVSGGEGSVTVTIDTVRDSLGPAIDLAAEMLTSPSFPADELEVVRQQILTWLEEQRQDPMQRGFVELFTTAAPWPDKDPRAFKDIEQQIARWKTIKVADLKAYHRDFWGAGKGELVVIGDFDAEAVTSLVEQRFGGWKAKKAYQRLPDKVFNVAPTEKKIDIKDKEMAMLGVIHDVELIDTAPDAAAAELVSYIAGGALGSRLWNRLREKEGFSYGTGAWLQAGTWDAAGVFAAYAVLAPQNLEKARAALLEELTKLATEGVGADELAKMKKAWLEQSLNALADDGGLTGTLADLLYKGRTLAWVKERHAAIEALTPEQVSAAAKKYIRPDRLIIVEAADYAKAKANAGK